jgi:hypothetical protein
MLALGRLHERGEGVARDETLALALYLRAAERDEPLAARAAARMTYEGIATPPDLGEALRLYQHAARLEGETRIQRLLALYDLTLAMRLKPGTGSPADDRRALDHLGRASANGSANATAELAVMLYHGWGAPQNTAEATRLFRAAAAAGSRRAQEWLRRLATH